MRLREAGAVEVIHIAAVHTLAGIVAAGFVAALIESAAAGLVANIALVAAEHI